MRVTWEIPSQYEQRPFRRVFRRLNRPVPSEAGIVTAYTDGQVTLRSNRAKERYHEAADLSTFQGVRPGDFVVHGLDIMRGSIGVADSGGAMSPVCVVASAREGIVPRYMAYQMRLQASTGYPKALARGVRDGGADFRRWDTLAELPLLCPPLSEQRAIADYLDRETAKIDTLIEKQTTMIERLRERRIATVNASIYGQAAERGQRRWLRLSRLVTVVRREIPPGSPLLSLYLGEGVIPFKADRVTNPTSQDTSHYQGVLPGDLVLNNQQAWRGSVGVSSIRGIISPAYIVCALSRQLAPRFAHYLFTADGSRAAFTLSSRGVGDIQRNVHWPTLKDQEFPFPPLEEQREIAGFLDRETAKIDTLIAKVERHIELAKERRAALITAAVTGQIDVTKDVA